MIKFEENEAHIRIHFEKQGIDHQLDMHLKKNKAKGVAIDRILVFPWALSPYNKFVPLAKFMESSS